MNGPLVLKIISRTDNLFSDDEFYGFKVFENGKFMINQNHKIVKSKKNAYYLDKNENKMDLTKSVHVLLDQSLFYKQFGIKIIKWDISLTKFLKNYHER